MAKVTLEKIHRDHRNTTKTEREENISSLPVTNIAVSSSSFFHGRGWRKKSHRCFTPFRNRERGHFRVVCEREFALRQTLGRKKSYQVRLAQPIEIPNWIIFSNFNTSGLYRGPTSSLFSPISLVNEEMLVFITAKVSRIDTNLQLHPPFYRWVTKKENSQLHKYYASRLTHRWRERNFETAILSCLLGPSHLHVHLKKRRKSETF